MNKVMMDILSLAIALSLLFSAIFVYEFSVTAGVTSASVIVSVDPPISTVAAGQNFMINVNISGVADLYGWEFKLRWNSALLDIIGVTEGSFLKRGSNTFFTYKMNNSEGYVLVDCTLLGDVCGVSGDGTLATVKFYVESGGGSVLDLYDTKLVSSQEQAIMHTAMDGYAYLLAAHDVAVTYVKVSDVEAYLGWIVGVNVTVRNEGTEAENLSVTAYCNATEIGSQTITNLNSGSEKTLIFSWNTTNVQPCAYYEIWAKADVVQNETDTTDNTCTDGTIHIKIPGDIDGDCYVGPIDLSVFAASYGKQAGQPLYNAQADFDKDDYVGPLDLSILAANYGKRC